MASTAAPPSTTGASAPGARPVESRDPATGEVWKRFEPVTTQQVAEALAAARRAQPAWAARPMAERAAILRRFHDILFERRHDVASCISRENGKPPAEALAEALTTLDFADFYSRRRVLRTLEPRRHRASTLSMLRKRILVTHEPFGVVGVIGPWNYPFMLIAAVTLPALVSGNAALIKPSEFTPQCGVLLGELLRAAGVPEGVVTVLPGAAETGAALIGAGCDKIFFTGSEPTGRKVAAECAGRLVPCVLELGGSDAALVLDDANLDQAVEGIVWGRFSNAGQTCVAPKRVFVHQAVHDEFLARLGRRVAALRAGTNREAVDVGPLIRPEQTNRIRAQLDDALHRGARVAASATADADDVVAPVVLTGVTPDMRVMREETFGPVLPVIPVRDDDDAVTRANDSAFGLSASVWTRDARRARRIAARLHSGTVAVNDVVVVAGMVDVAHGGVKASGMGRAHGLEGLRECVQVRTVVEERLPGVRQPWWFGPDTHDGLDAFATVAHGRGLFARLRALRRVGRLLRPPA